MSTRDDSRGRQQGAGGSQATQQGGSSASSTQQDQFNPGNAQQGGSNVAPRTGGGFAPSLWGARGGGPIELMRRLEDDMDRLFQQFWGAGRSLMRGRGGELPSMWMPPVEVFERDGKLHVHADLPGMKKEDIKLTIEADQLVLQGERRSSHEEGEQQGGYYHTERSYGSFYRTIPLPEGVDPAKADASFKDGVLEVVFDAPRKQQAQGRQIDIR